MIGALYLGIATPTEAGAVGAAGAALLCALRRRLSLAVLAESLREAATVTSFLLLIVVGAAQAGYLLDYLQLPAALIGLVEALEPGPAGILLGLVLAYVLLGMVIDPFSMMLMTLPVVLPLVASAGFDPLWFGVVLVAVIEIGLITPPVGMILFVLKGIGGAETELGDVALGALPFVLAILAGILLLYLLPGIATWLPAQAL